MPDQPLSPTIPTSDERTLAGLSHLLGLFVALIVWATQKDKSRFVRFQAIQAMAFDLAVMVVIFVLVGCMMVVMFGSMILGMGGMVFTTQDQNTAAPLYTILFTLIFSLPFLLMCPLFLVVGAIVVARWVAAIYAFQGRDFHYPWLGNRLEKWLDGEGAVIK